MTATVAATLERSFDPIQLLKVIRRWAPVVLFMVVLGGGLSFVIARVSQPSYQACGLARVAPGAQATGRATAPTAVTQTDSVLMTQNAVLDQVIRDLRLRTTNAKLREHVSAVAGPSSELITVCTNGDMAHDTATITNAVMSEFASQVAAQAESAIDQAGSSLQSQIQTVETALEEENAQLVALRRSHGDTTALAGQIQADTSTLAQLT